jgi:uncharacterized protein
LNKLLVLVLVVVAVWWLAKGFRRRGAARDAPASSSEQHMVTCGHCGLYLPQGEAIAEGNKYFCSDEHRQLAR